MSTDKLEAYANQRSETEEAYEIIQSLSRGSLQDSFVIHFFLCFLYSSFTDLPVSKFSAFALRQFCRAFYYQEDFFSAFLKFSLSLFLLHSPCSGLANVTLSNFSGCLVEKHQFRRVRFCIGDHSL